MTPLPRAPWRPCITSSQRRPQDLRRRMHAFPWAVHELRLDFLEAVPRDPAGLVRGPVPTLVAVRPRREGGVFDGSERDRIALLERAVDGGPEFVDLELSTPGPLRRRIYDAAGSRVKVILSVHDLRGIPHDLHDLVRRMESEPAPILKLALRVEDAAGLSRLLEAARAATRPTILVGMGEGGLVSRIAPERFGSPLCYLALSPRLSTAEGQLTLEDAALYRRGRGARPGLLGIVGNRAALNSHGMRVYNTLFARRRLDLAYAPVITASLESVLASLRALGFRGVSVTQPFKEEALRLCDRTSPEAVEAGAVNTLRFERSGTFGANTDVLAARRIFSALARRKGSRKLRAAIVGAGGAARAVAAAAASIGWDGAVYNRTPERARTLARAFGFEAHPLGALAEGGCDADILVNCTSVGMDSTASIIRHPRFLAGKIVMDLVSHPPRTRLLAMAERAGAGTVAGTHFWAVQGREQMKILAGVDWGLQSIKKLLRSDEY
jgi:3-dehydroquinate dehydratase/shikimate dehydrogenase